MWPFSLVRRWQRRRQRHLDRGLLFPAMRAHQKSWEEGTLLILHHVQHDPAWRDPREWQGELLELPEESPHD